MRKLLLLLMMSCTWLFSVGQGTVSTVPTLTGTNSSGGITFSVRSNSPANITGMTNQFSTASTADVWYKPGGAGTPPGTISTANGWILAVSGASVTPSAGTAVNIPFGGATIPVPSSGSVGIHIAASNTNYRTGAAGDQVIFTDGTFTVDVNDSVAYGGFPTPTFNPRRFLGSVTYALAVTGNCTPFTNFTIDSISAGAAKLNWTPGASNTSFKVEYGTAGFTPGTGTTVTGTYPSTTQPPVILTGLTANTAYDVWIEEYCNTGSDTVGFPTPQGFTTTKLCAAPTAFTDSNLTSNSIDLGWAQAGSYNSAWILYGPAGTTPGSAGWFIDTVQSPATTYTITTLNSSTAYDIYLATNCGSVNGISDTVGPISITTPISGPQGLTCTVGSAGPVFADDFETVGSWTGNFGTGASNWNYNTGGTGSGSTGPSGAHSGSTYIYTETSGTGAGTNIEAITPRIDLSTSFNSAELSFWLHAYGSGIDTVKVQVGNSASGPWTTVFTNVGQLQTDELDPWQNVGVNLNSYVGSAIHLRFLVVHGGGFQGDVGIDLVEVNSCQTCPNPGNPSLTGLTADSAFFSWVGTGNSYDINWGPAGFTQGSASSSFDSTTTTNIAIGGLSGNTAYDLYLRNDCSDSANGFSGWVGPLTFVTLCNPFTAPYTNNFDTDSLGEAPICWDNVIIGGSSTTAPAAAVTLESSFNPAVSPANYIRFYNFNVDTLWLVSPQFSDMTNSGNRISFQARTTTTATGNDIVIGSISSPGNNASFSAFDTITITNTYAQYVIDITAANGYNGTDEFLVIAHDGPNFRTYYIDDFVYEAIPSCNPPLVSSLGVNYTTATAAEVYWGSGSDGDTTFIEYGPLGFTPGVGATGVISVSGSVDTALITGLTSETDYEFYVQDSCYGDGTSPYVGPVAFKTACAISVAANLPLADGFEAYTSGPTFSGANAYLCNPSYNWTFEPGGNGRARLQAGTGYYNNGSQAFTMDQGSFFSGGATNYMTMTVNLSNYTTSGGITLTFNLMDHGNPAHPDNRVWVRGDANDAWIEILNIDNLPATNGQWDSIAAIDILAPIVGAGQAVGANTQIRFGQYGSSSSFSTSFSDGYTIDDVLLEAVSCPKPSSLSVSNLLDTAGTLDWNAVGTASNYEVWFGPAGFYQGTTTTAGVRVFTTGDSLLVDTISEQTCYEFLVRGACSPGDTSLWEGPFQFCTPCSPISAPYFENWDGLAAQSKDLGCFTSYESPAFANSSFSGVTIQSSTFYNPISSPNYVELDNSSDITTPLMLISPLTSDLTDGDKRVRFSYRTTSTFNPTKIIVGTISDASNPGTFNAIDTITPTTTFTEYIVELNSANGYNGTDNRFAFAHSLESTFDVLLIDDLHYERIPTCIRPTSLSVASISDTSATISWVDASGTGSNYQVEYGINPLGDPGNTRVSATSASITPNNLTPGTGYCVWVREICTPGDTSFWRGPECFATLCPLNGYMAPYFTNFTGISIGQASGTPSGWENCWTHSNTGSVRWESEDASGSNENSLNTGPFFDATTPNASGGVYMYLETSSSGGPAELTSPLINVSSLNNPELEYYYHMFGATINYLLVFAEDGAGVRTQIDSINGQQQTAGSDPFSMRTVPLSGVTATSFHIVFQGHRGTSFTGDISIDDVSVQEGVTCPRPTGFSQTASGLTTATIAWNAGTGNNFDIEYGPTGFTQGAGTIVNTTASPYQVTGLTAATTYDVYIREVCTPGDTSTWAGPFQMATNLCNSSSQCMFYFDLTDSFGDGWNGAQISIQQNGVEVVKLGAGFSTGNLLQDSVLLCNGLTTDIILDPAGTWASEIGVIVYDNQNAPVDSFTIASPTPNTGDTLISFTSSCGFPCPDPTGLTATSNVGCDSLEVDWVSASGGSVIEYGVSGFALGSGTMTAVVTAPYTITGLNPGVAYDVYVADTCTGDTSNYMMLTTSTATAPVPTAVAGVTDTIIGGQYTVFVDAGNSNNATAYDWDFGNGVTSTNAMDTIVFLGNGVYNIVLTATNACGTSTDTVTINVNIGLEDNPLANSLSVYPNPAQYTVNVSFREVGSADVQITLRDAQGRSVIYMDDRMQSGTYSNDIDVSGLARGIYMLEIKSGSLEAHRRVSIK